LKRAIFNVYVFAALLFGMLIGLAGAFGACVPIWGSSILDTALGDPPDRSHPAFWVAMLLLVPAMLLGAAGSLTLLILPVAFRFPNAAAITRSDGRTCLDLLRSYAERVLKYVAAQEERLSDDQNDLK
jgi:hypothetical protein